MESLHVTGFRSPSKCQSLFHGDRRHHLKHGWQWASGDRHGCGSLERYVDTSNAAKAILSLPEQSVRNDHRNRVLRRRIGW